MTGSPSVQSDKCNTTATVQDVLPTPVSPVRQEAVRISADASSRSPKTPRLQLLQAASGPPPVLQRRRLSSAPRATHPVLAAAFAKTSKSTVSASQHQQQRPPTRRRLLTSPTRAATLPAPDTSFAFAPHGAAGRLLSNQIESLPTPEEALQQVMAKDASLLSLGRPTPSGLLTTLLQHTNLDAVSDDEDLVRQRYVV